MSFIQDCSNQTLLKLQSYLTKRGIIIQDIEEYKGLYNKEFGDLKITGFTLDDMLINLNIDFKKQTKDDAYIYIELLFINAAGEYGGWLWNPKETHIVYELKNGRTFIFTHEQLLQIAKNYNTDEMWNTSIIYSKNPIQYEKQRNWITQKLNECNAEPLYLPNIKISPSNSHIRACYNYAYNRKILSGFSIALEPDTVEQFEVLSGRTIV